jgi:hypothetical protein
MASTVSFKLLAIGEPAAYFLNPLAAHADLTRTVARIRHRQHEDLVAFATRAFLDPVRRRTMRSNSMPRSNSPVTGNCRRACRVPMAFSPIIHRNEPIQAPGVNLNLYGLAAFGLATDSRAATTSANFAPEVAIRFSTATA